MLDATQPRPGAADVHAAADLPFDKKHLDNLLEAANIDILLVTSKHNIQYMLGGYRFFFFDQFDAIGITRYLPIIIYPKGRPDRAVYVGNAMEDSEAENGRFWCPDGRNKLLGHAGRHGARDRSHPAHHAAERQNRS
jgi:hypothetical protein